MKTKTITIEDEQEQYIQDKSLNLSRFVQKALNERIKKNGKSNSIIF